MAVLHLFVGSGRFASFEEIRSFVEPTYTHDGELVPSELMDEVQLEAFEPACIEVIWEPRTRPLSELLRESSWADQWLPHVDGSLRASEAICVFEPNLVRNPMGTSLKYCGSYRYRPHSRSS